MTPRQRARCPHCKKHGAVNRDGTMRAHWLPNADGERPITNRCPGVGRSPSSHNPRHVSKEIPHART